MIKARPRMSTSKQMYMIYNICIYTHIYIELVGVLPRSFVVLCSLFVSFEHETMKLKSRSALYNVHAARERLIELHTSF